jgi:hypothetical protein
MHLPEMNLMTRRPRTASPGAPTITLAVPAVPPLSQGRHVLWGYMKELRNVPAPPCLCNKYSYAGCVSLPRALYIRGDRLFQVTERHGCCTLDLLSIGQSGIRARSCPRPPPGPHSFQSLIR